MRDNDIFCFCFFDRGGHFLAVGFRDVVAILHADRLKRESAVRLDHVEDVIGNAGFFGRASCLPCGVVEAINRAAGKDKMDLIFHGFWQYPKKRIG